MVPTRPLLLALAGAILAGVAVGIVVAGAFAVAASVLFRCG